MEVAEVRGYGERDGDEGWCGSGEACVCVSVAEALEFIVKMTISMSMFIGAECL